MLRQSLPQQQTFESSSSSNDNKNMIDINRSLLLDIVQEIHLLYNMEIRDRPNNIVRVLVELHKLGATQEQLSTTFQKTRLEAEPIRIPDVGKINENNWEEYLGTASLYSDYLVFFDHQLPLLGLKETLTKYFYSIPFSIGSQLQPLVHLAFGIKHDLPEIITQALAYYASSYIDVSNILSYCQDYTANNQIIVAPNDRLADTMLFNLVQADQRFDGKIEGNNTFQSAVKLLLKSKSDLIKTYMLTWSSSVQNPKQRLNALIQTATTLSKMASRQQHDTAHVDLDWFLAGGQLMDAALAIQSLIMNDDQLENWVNLLFLTMLCTFVVQGRPAVMIHSECVNKRGWDACISQVVQTSFDDPKLILALSSILRARHYGDLGPTCLEIANTLASFAEDGTWIKAGLGWSN